MCSLAQKNNKQYILIIDEINRAHLAGVLGELIYGLEYRNRPISTSYAINGSNAIKVPKNLHIIGTMNTADRSIGHIDYAVRRRFSFHQMLPDRKSIKNYYHERHAIMTMALILFDAVSDLFKGNNALSKDFHREDVQPGHTYFMAKDESDLKSKFIYQIVPLLREYVKDGVLKPSAELTIRNSRYRLIDDTIDDPIAHQNNLNSWLSQALD